MGMRKAECDFGEVGAVARRSGWPPDDHLSVAERQNFRASVRSIQEKETPAVVERFRVAAWTAHDNRRRTARQRDVEKVTVTTDQWNAMAMLPGGSADPNAPLLGLNDPDFFKGREQIVPKSISDPEKFRLLQHYDLMEFILLRNGFGAKGDPKGRMWCPSCQPEGMRRGHDPRFKIYTRKESKNCKDFRTKEAYSVVIFRAKYFCTGCKSSGDIVSLASLVGGEELGKFKKGGSLFLRSIARLKAWEKEWNAEGGRLFAPLNPKERIRWLRAHVRGWFTCPLVTRAVLGCIADTGNKKGAPRNAMDLMMRIVMAMNGVPKKNYVIIYREVLEFWKKFRGDMAQIYAASNTGETPPHTLDVMRGRLAGKWLEEYRIKDAPAAGRKRKSRRHARTLVLMDCFYKCFWKRTPSAEAVAKAVGVCGVTAKRVMRMLRDLGFIWKPKGTSSAGGGWRMGMCKNLGMSLLREISFIQRRGHSPPMWVRQVVYKLCGVEPQGKLFGGTGGDDWLAWRRDVESRIASPRHAEWVRGLIGKISGGKGSPTAADGFRRLGEVAGVSEEGEYGHTQGFVHA